MTKLTGLLVTIGVFVAAFIVTVSLFLPISDKPVTADAIVAVSGGDTQGRARHAIKLYQEGYAPKLVFSGAAADPDSASNAKVMMSIAAARGVPTSAISLDEYSRDTKENAQKSKEILGGASTIILVTSDYHQRRVNHEFQKALGPDVRLINAPAKDKNWGRKSWFFTPYGWYISITEPVKLLFSRATL